ncbi:MAG: DUF1330 domain-containing protein [Pseudomonadota bacterium]
MSAFLLFDDLEVLDPEKLEAYARDAAPIVERFHGKYRSVGGETRVLEGSGSPKGPVLIEFDNAVAALEWYNSDAYRPLKARRQEAVACNSVLIEGG